MGNDFIVESRGHCFICLERTLLQKSHLRVKIEGKVDLFPVYSLQSLSRCLKMDMSKVFNQKEPIPHQLLDQVQNSKLNAELCEECVVLNDRVTKSCRQMEKIKMELESSLNIMHGKFGKSELSNQLGKGLANPSGNSSSDWKGKLQILDNLRKEATQKCFRKLGCRLPRITVENLSKKEVARHKLKLKKASPIDVRSSLEPELSDEGLAPIKFERDDTKHEADSLPGDEDNDKASYYDNDNSYMDNEDNIVQESTQADQQGDEAGGGSSTFSAVFQSISDERRGSQEQRYIFNPATGKYKCTACSKELFNQSTASRHYKSIHQKVKYKCGLCKNEFTLLTSYKIHHQNVHLGVRFKCASCNKVFKHKKNLRIHQKQTSCGEKT